MSYDWKPADGGFGQSEMFRFEKAGDTLDFMPTNVKEGVTTKFGTLTIVEGTTLETETPVAIIISAGLKAFDWFSMIGKPCRVVYEGQQKNPSSGRMFKKFEVFVAG